MPQERRLQLCFLKMNIQVNFALPWWWIVLLQKPLHSSTTLGGAASYPPPPMVLLHYNRCSSISISSPQSGLVLRYFIQHSILHFFWCSSRMGAFRPRSGAPLFYSRLIISLPLGDAQHTWATPLDRRSLTSICAPQFHSALLHHHHHSPCPPCTPHQALHLSWWHTSFPHELIILPFKLHVDSLWPDLTSQMQPFWYHKSSQTTFEINFAHSPGPNHLEIQGASAASLPRWWIVSTCVCRPW